MAKIKLTEHFSLSEFEASNTAKQIAFSVIILLVV